jgi:hypothetical protein
VRGRRPARGTNDTPFLAACSVTLRSAARGSESRSGPARADHTLAPAARGPESRALCSLAPQYLHELLELGPDLPDDLLALGRVRARFLATEFVARAADRKALVI